MRNRNMVYNEKRSKIVTVGCILIFLLLFVYNYLSLYIADDFSYLYSFADGKRISSIQDIFYSMIAHSQTMNGRLVVHTLVQFFGMLPPVIFDVVNALMFAAYILLLYRISVGHEENVWLFFGIFSLVWLYQPGFSDVVLWQDGACNYLWAIVFGLMFIRVFVNECFFSLQIQGLCKKAAFLVFSLLFGAYSENISFACILMAATAVGGNVILNKKKVSPYLAMAIALACMGYVSIYLAPAQWMNKAGGLDIVSLLTAFVNAVIAYKMFGILCVAFVVLMTVNVYEKTDKNILLLGALFLLGSLAANFIMVFAKVYQPRSATGAFAFLLVADAVLMQALFHNEKCNRAVLISLLATAMVVTVPALAEATRDIGKTYIEIRQNEAYIEECRAKGIMDIELPLLTSARTEYSIAYQGGSYLNTETSQTWPNADMAKYYGVDSIIGIVIPERVLDDYAYE